MKKSYLSLFFCFMILQACGGSGSDGSGTNPGGGGGGGEGGGGGGNPQSLSLNSIGNKFVLGGETLNFTLSASNPNGGTLTYMANGTNNATNPLTLTNRVSFNESSGVFNWATLAGDTGSYNITFSVANNSESDSESITISVQNEVQYGESIFAPNCGRCHGNDGLGGGDSQFIIGAPTAEQMEQAFDLSQNDTMNDFTGVFSLAEREAMYRYLCTFPANSC